MELVVLRGLNHITIAVSNLDRSLVFYTKLLGMRAHVGWENGAYLSLGGVWCCLSRDSVLPSQDYSHIALDIAEQDCPKFREKLLSAEVIEWKQNSSEGNSIYFLDPDKNKFEVHSGDLNSLLASLKRRKYSGLIWLESA